MSPSDKIVLNGEDVIRAIYRVLLLREPEEAGRTSHLDQLTMGADLEALLRSFIKSAEFLANFPAFYREYLDVNRSRLTVDSSQYGEVDLLVRQMLNDAARHRIAVDVGARGRERSNSYDLLRFCGWKGLLVEANPSLIPAIEAEFAGLDIRLVQCAVSDHEGAELLHIGVNDDVSSLTEVYASAWGQTRGTVPVSVRRLGNLLAEHQIPTDFDLLSLDIEGEDVKVMNDLVTTTNYRPIWVIIEASFDFSTKSLHDLPFSDKIRDSYVIVGQTASNLILRNCEPLAQNQRVARL